MKKIYASIVLLFFISFSFSQNNKETIEKLKNQLSIEKNDTAKAKTLKELAVYYTELSTDSAMKYGKLAIVSAKKLNDKTLLAKIYNDLAYVQMIKGNSNECMSYFRKSLSIYKEKENLVGQGKIYANICANYMQYEMLDSAMIYGLKAKEIFEFKGLDNYINFVDSNLASIYEGMKNYEKSLEYNLKVLNATKRTDDLAGLGITYNNIAETYYKLDSIKKAEQYYKKAVDIGENIKDYQILGASLANLADLYLQNDKLDLGIAFANRAIQYKNYLNSERQEAFLNYILATSYFKQEKFSKALIHFKQAIKYFEINKDVRKVAQVKRFQSIIYANLNRKKISVKLQYESDSIINQLNELESNKKLQELEVKYQSEKKEKELLQTRTEKAEAELSLAKTQTWIYVLIGGLFIIIVLFFAISQRNKRKAQQQITAQKELGFKAIIDAQEEERSKIARELHDGVVQQIGSVILKSRNLFSKKNLIEEKESKELLESLENSNQDLRNISHQMMPRALKELGIIAALSDLLEGSLAYLNINYNIEHFNIEHRLPQKIEITIYRIAQELINNIIKHSKATEVSLQLFNTNNTVILIVEDNGVGFSSKEKKKGIGLLNISSRLDIVNGNVNFEPSPKSGTLVTVKIPL